MKRFLLLLIAAACLSPRVSAQLFSTTFNNAYNLDTFTSFSNTTSYKFNGIGPVASGSGPGASIVLNGTKKLQLVRSGSVASFFVRKYLGYNWLERPAYGALIGVNNPSVNKPVVAKRLGIIHIRDAFMISDRSTWSAAMYDLGFKIVLNANWASTAGGPVAFPDSTRFRDSLITMLTYTGIRPSLLVIENEERNKGYHIGSTQDYIKELTAAVRVAHNYGLKVTNGGLTAEALRKATWTWLSDLSVPGHTQARADAYKAKTLGDTHYNALWLDTSAKFVDTLVKAYANIPIDYINFHWYAGDGSTGSQTDILGDVVDYLETVSGKKAMTNEIGQYNLLGATADSLLDFAKTRNLPFMIWYDNDGTSADAPAEALSNLNATLRSNGIVYRDSLAAHGGAYIPSRFVSVQFKVNATGISGGATTIGNEIAMGNGFTVDAAAPAVADSVNSSLSIIFTATNGFKLKENTAGATYPSGNFSGEQSIKWYLNTSGSLKSYTAPSGSSEDLATGRFDVWVKPSSGGTWTRAFNDVSCKFPGTWMSDIKFIFDTGTATLQFDDVLVTDESGNFPYGRMRTLGEEALAPDAVSALQVVPGKSSLRVQVTSETGGKAILSVYNMAGARMIAADASLQAGINTLQLPGLAAHGVYLIEVSENGKRLAKKFLW